MSVNGQDERRIRAAVDSPARRFRGGSKSAAAPRYDSEGGISTTDQKAHQGYIQRRRNALCKAVIRRLVKAAGLEKILLPDLASGHFAPRRLYQ